jgi:AcrR family transcriptional regulator
VAGALERVTPAPGRKPAGRQDGRRREALIAAAYARIAEQGFEGLRTRDVAAEVGVNVATLHYYFPTKEALIRGVVGHAMQRFRTTLTAEGNAAQQLAHHLAGVRRLALEEPELFAVMGELALRSTRDAATAAIFDETTDAWHARLRVLVSRARDQGFLAPALEPDETAAAIVATLKGACMVPAGSHPERTDQALRQVVRWLGLSSGDEA